MVRFSDLLGGNDTPEEQPRPAATPREPTEIDGSATDALDDDAEDVLERLTQFATSARSSGVAADAEVPTPEPSADPASVPDAQADAPPALTPVADDLLPRGKGGKSRKGRH
jgi:hypothetical protein